MTRRKMMEGEMPIDWGYAEILAYATLLNEGYPVRLSGQDCGVVHFPIVMQYCMIKNR